jgi:serine/threonine protein kinase
MVSPWCENGTICHYLKLNPTADRLKLVRTELSLSSFVFPRYDQHLCQILEIALGVSYLHGFSPTIIHGDLKGVSAGQEPCTAFVKMIYAQGNILVNEHGRAVITDFGLSRVLEEVSDSLSPGTSFFAGSTRYMSPELVLALVEDDGGPPPITTHSDVWAFACVCLEVNIGSIFSSVKAKTLIGTF